MTSCFAPASESAAQGVGISNVAMTPGQGSISAEHRAHVIRALAKYGLSLCLRSQRPTQEKLREARQSLNAAAAAGDLLRLENRCGRRRGRRFRLCGER